MGEVYRARDTRLDRTVAVKILSSHLSSNPEAKQRFEREARAISSLNHPHICTLYDVGHQDGTDYLVMEFLEGETLADACGRDRCLRSRFSNTASRLAKVWKELIAPGWFTATSSPATSCSRKPEPS
jgi:serine/threonine protein kinase